MTTNSDDRTLDKIRKLLAQADDDSGATVAEREVFAQKAAELMARHMVTEAMLDAARDLTNDPVDKIAILIQNPYSRPKVVLLAHIAEALNCQLIRTHDGAFIFGRRSNLERVEFLYTSLLVQAMTLVGGVSSGGTASQTRSFRGNWLLGFGRRIGDRMTAGREDAAREAGSGAALVLRNQRAEASEALHAEFPRTRTTVVRATNARGYSTGQRAADRADIGATTRIGPKRRAIGA